MCTGWLMSRKGCWRQPYMGIQGLCVTVQGKNGGETKVYGEDFSCGNQLQHKDEGAFLQGGSVVEDLQGETSFVLVCLGAIMT